MVTILFRKDSINDWCEDCECEFRGDVYDHLEAYHKELYDDSIAMNKCQVRDCTSEGAFMWMINPFTEVKDSVRICLKHKNMDSHGYQYKDGILDINP